MTKKNFTWICIGVFALWAVSGIGIYFFIDKDFRGVAGDMFGAVNALFSGFAFAGLIYTISVQREELKGQIKAIKMQTDELSLQRRAIEMQTKELRLQITETARSADQLERQRQLLDYQIVFATVNDLIKLKNNLIREYECHSQHLKINAKYSAFKKLSLFIEREPNKSFDAEILVSIQQYAETYFFLLELIDKADLTESMINDLKKIVKINTTVDEVTVLVRSSMEFNNEQYRKLLKSFNLK